jgi:hypothetical protein
MNKIDEIFDLELNRIHEAAKKGPLDNDEVRRLSMLVDSYKKYEQKHQAAESGLDGLSVHELIALWEKLNNGTNQNAGKVATCGEDGKQEGAGRAVDAGRDTPPAPRPKPARNGKRVPNVE